MKDLEIMHRMENLEEQLKLLKELESKKEELEKNCKHNIIVVTSEDNCYSINAKCLFCGRKFESSRALYEYEAVVDISEYYCVFWNDEKMISEVKKMYNDILSQNENLQPAEISEIIRERFKENYYETKVILEDIARKVRGEI